MASLDFMKTVAGKARVGCVPTAGCNHFVFGAKNICNEERRAAIRDLGQTLDSWLGLFVARWGTLEKKIASRIPLITAPEFPIILLRSC